MAGSRCQSLVSKISYRRKKDVFMINLLQVCRTRLFANDRLLAVFLGFGWEPLSRYFWACSHHLGLCEERDTHTIPKDSHHHLTVPRAIGSFSNDDGDGNQDVKKAIGLLRKTTTLHVHHAFLYISSPSLHDYDVKMPNCKFYGGRKQATTNLFSSL